MKKKKFVILDGNSILFRAFYALPPLKNKKGVFTNAIYGFLSMLYKLLDEYQPDYICVAFDPKKPTFRHEKYKEYKAGRAKAPDELIMQFGMIRDVLGVHGIEYLEIEGFEADDIAGTLATHAAKENIEVFLVTSDKDYLQLVKDNVTVLLTKKGVTNIVAYNRGSLYEEYGITPKEFIELKALMGDSSDNIPGVKGIGEKTGLKLIQQYRNLDNLYLHIDEIKGKLKEKLESEKIQAYLSRELSEIVLDIPVSFDLNKYKLKDMNQKALMDIYQELGFRLFMSRIKTEQDNQLSIFEENSFIQANQLPNSDEPLKIIEITAKKAIQQIKQEKSIGLKFLYDGERAYFSEPVALGIMTESLTLYYFEAPIEEVISTFKNFFEDQNVKKISHDIKDEMIILEKFGIALKGVVFDTLIAKYLLSPSDSSYRIERLVYEVLREDMKGKDDYLGTGKNKSQFVDLSKDEKKGYLYSYLKGVLQIRNTLEKELMEKDMDRLYEDMELPLVKVMASMETLGFKIDVSELRNIGAKLTKKIEILEKIIYDHAGMSFNINSPKQLGEILFVELELPTTKKTKTGFSTDIEVLEKLKAMHPIVPKLIEYRQLSKLNSTYVEGLLNLVEDNSHRVHSSFKQAIASTGRISSTDPNLQNIPVKTEEGRELRKVFVAEEGYCLVDADYSQIELRVLAHLSQDQNLIEAFINNEDIHTKTASQVFHVPFDKVTPLMRSRAKAVNFGIVYGISDYGLSRDLDIPRKESKAYIENYLNFFSGVREYMEGIIQKGKRDGYVETVFGRRRDIPELASRNFNIRAFGERLALNTPVQGTAADIIKRAMINVYEKLSVNHLKSRLILQVHDELIVEAHHEEIEVVKKILKEEMEGAAQLLVPLTVDLNVGTSWYEAK
ncbi:MAG: DNA polymerase I [Tissierellales bacterium]|nr:DNA polymerase I [Tissierellales bacterium]MBN2828134.1 DNA polymerase I [Tissierellales bacterium]